MPKIKLKNAEITQEIAGEVARFPKYTSQLMNLANQNSQGTRPKIVGQMTDLFQEFTGREFEEWEAWYLEQQKEEQEYWEKVAEDQREMEEKEELGMYYDEKNRSGVQKTNKGQHMDNSQTTQGYS